MHPEKLNQTLGSCIVDREAERHRPRLGSLEDKLTPLRVVLLLRAHSDRLVPLLLLGLSRLPDGALHRMILGSILSTALLPLAQRRDHRLLSRALACA